MLESPAQAGAKPRRRWRVVGWLLLFVLVLVVVGAVVAVRLAKARIGDALESTAAARGLAISWDAIEIHLDGRIDVLGVAFRTEREGLLEGRVNQLSTRVDWRAALRGERPQQVEIQGMQLRADADGVRSLRQAGASEAEEEPTSDTPLRLTITDLEGVFHAGPTETVLCRAGELTAELRPRTHLRGTLDCRAPQLGLTTGPFHLEARYARESPEPIQLVLEPTAAFETHVAGARFGRVSASLGPEGGRVDVAALALTPDPSSQPGPLLIEEVTVDSIRLEVERREHQTVLRRIQAGPGEVRLSLADSSEVEPEPTTDDRDENEDEDEDDQTPLPLDEAADAAAGIGVTTANWDALEADLAELTQTLQRAMALATSVADRVEMSQVVVSVERAGAQPVTADLATLTAVPGHAEAELRLAEHDITVSIDRAAEDALSLSLVADSVDLELVSRALGRPGLVAGHLQLALGLQAGDTFHANLEASSEDFVFWHEGVSPAPLTFLPGRLEASLDYDASQRRRLTATLEGELGDALAGRLDARVSTRDDGSRLEVDFAIDETTCQALLEALPDGLFVHMPRSEILMAGRAGLEGSVRYDFGDPHSFRLSFGEAFPGTCEILELPEGFHPEVLLDEAYVHEVPAEYLTEGAEPVFVGPGTDGWVPLDTLPEYVQAIMYFTEQRRFYEEPPISVRLISRAVRVNLIYDRWAYGGSTITQQLVKNLFFDRGKSLARKLQEALVSWAMFSMLSYDEILELYVNCIEFGPDIWGIEAAAQFYFGIPARQLAPPQAVYLAGLKPSPRSGGNHRRRGQSPSRARWRNRIRDRLQELADAGYIDPIEVQLAAPYIVEFSDPEAGATPQIEPID